MSLRNLLGSRRRVPVWFIAALLATGVGCTKDSGDKPSAGGGAVDTGDVTLTVSSVIVPKLGDEASICVSLDTRGQSVAGTQNDLVWDGTCASMVTDSCVANEAHGKTLHGNAPPGAESTYRTLLFAMNNVDPMPDGDVYCCKFQVKMTEPGTCCAVTPTRLGVSDPSGNALKTTGVPGEICLIASGESAQGASAQAQSQKKGGFGCQLAPAANGWFGLFSLGMGLLVLFLRSKT